MIKLKMVVLLTALFFASSVSAAVPVFPGAEGFGSTTVAGRGGQIIKVTNLNDSGEGSLRAAIYKSGGGLGPRTVVFEVGGVINLQSVIVVRDPFVTIAGQSAPSPGITLANYGLRIYTHDVLVQHIFVRTDPTLTAGGGDAIAIKDSAPDYPYNIVIDHCSVSWANDENLSIFPGYGNQTDQNVTISNSLAGEGHYGVLIGSNATKISLLRNAVVSTLERQPRLGGGTYANIVNNVFYNNANTTFSVVGSTWGSDQVSYAGNTFIAGPSTSLSAKGISVSYIQSGSRVYAPISGVDANLAIGGLTSTTVVPYLVSTPPVSLTGITVTPVSGVEADVLKNVGARPAERATQYANQIDVRFIDEIKNRKGSVKNREVQPWIKPNSTTRSLASLLPSNPSADSDSDGYTNIEEILHQMAAQVEGKTATPTPTPSNPGSFEFANSGYSINENAGKVDITIKRTGGTQGPASVQWRTLGNTASYGVDYATFVWITLNFTDGEESKTLPIEIFQDTISETNEVFNVLLQSPTNGATLGAIINVPVTIVDDDITLVSSPITSPEPTLSPTPTPTPTPEPTPITTPEPEQLPIKYNRDDFNKLFPNWSKNGTGLQGDLNNDGKVNAKDLGIMMSNWE